MALCGFNDKIGAGLRMLFEGISESIETKATARSPLDVVARELIELDEIVAVLKTAPEETLPSMFAGLNLLAKALFLEVKDDLQRDADRSLTSLCTETGEAFIELLAETEFENERMPLVEWTHDAIAARARMLAQWSLRKNAEQVPELQAIV